MKKFIRAVTSASRFHFVSCHVTARGIQVLFGGIFSNSSCPDDQDSLSLSLPLPLPLPLSLLSSERCLRKPRVLCGSHDDADQELLLSLRSTLWPVIAMLRTCSVPTSTPSIRKDTWAEAAAVPESTAISSKRSSK